MPISGSSVLAWGHRTLSVAVEAGSRLRARLTAVAGCGGRAVEQPPPAVAGPVASSAAPQQRPSGPPTVAGPGTTPASPAHPQRPGSARAATASVTPAMVRRGAHEQGIQIADRGRIPQSVMVQYGA